MTNVPDDDVNVPLIVDLDGTLVRSDMLMESFWKGMGLSPVRTVRTALKFLRHRAGLKQAVTRIALPTVETLPMDTDVAAYIARARAAGRQVHLVSGADQAAVDAVAEVYGPFTSAIGSDGEVNLTAARKTAYLVDRFGAGGFDYIGDSGADIPVWKAARTGFVARPTAALATRVKAAGVAPLPMGRGWEWGALLRGLRPHQWLKNGLLVLPLIAAHRVDPAGIMAVLVGMVAFSALASAIYIVNDLTDLDADRLHSSKFARPFAAGAVPIRVGMGVSVGLGLFGLALGAFLGPWMVLVLTIYLISTLSYSMHFKRVRWVDITMLAGLYTLRVIAGAVAAGVVASGWLFAFIFPVFLSLGCVKRLTELSRAEGDGFLPGRRYKPADRTDLLNVSILAAIGSVAVFVAYSLSQTASALYASVFVLWLVAVLLAAWLGRMIHTGWTGEQDYDPILFAITDRKGLVLLIAAFVLLVIGAR